MAVTVPAAAAVPAPAPPRAHAPVRLGGAVQVAPGGAAGARVLTPDALAFVGLLHSAFAGRRAELLDRRRERRRRLATGEEELGFLPQTLAIRQDPAWRVAPPGPGLTTRRVEITGPPEPRMAVNALNSGADVWMADLEDSTAPTWQNVLGGQLALLEAVEGTLHVSTPHKQYRLREGRRPTVVVRPRGWHLVEKHVRIDGSAVPAGLVDFGLHFFHCARRQIECGAGPYYYLPKLEGHLEARLWNDVFRLAQDELGIPRGTVRATVLVETLPAAFEMEEILHELREHAAGLNAGRWDYVFSAIKCLRGRDDRSVLPDRSAVTMTVPFMRAYTELLVRTCHRRGAHAIGGMAAAVPDRGRPEATQRALAAVRADKEREARDGFDGSWVAHPDLVPVCREVFDDALGDRPDQRHRLREDVHVTAQDLLAVPGLPARVTPEGVRGNVSVALRYLAAWVAGRGAVALDGLMEDAATAEIARCQLWQWIRHGTTMTDGRTVTRELVADLVEEEHRRFEEETGPAGAPAAAAARELLVEVSLGEDLPEFLTVPGYARHLAHGTAG